jgi:hypothetical protein
MDPLDREASVEIEARPVDRVLGGATRGDRRRARRQPGCGVGFVRYPIHQAIRSASSASTRRPV